VNLKKTIKDIGKKNLVLKTILYNVFLKVFFLTFFIQMIALTSDAHYGAVLENFP